jgi:ribonuclease HI
MNRSLFDVEPSAVVQAESDVTKTKTLIWCDGACSGNPGAGGWGCILEENGVRRELSGGRAHTTNNQMELQALIEALRAVPEGQAVEVVTDSEYLTKGITQWLRGWMRNGWKTASKQPVKNKEQWQEIHALLQTRPYQIQWVRGHNGHAENERCDELARAAIQQYRR